MGIAGQARDDWSETEHSQSSTPKKKQTMSRTGFVYFITNAYNNVLYIGVTNNLARRVAEHKAKINKGFTYKYNCDKLVYYEVFDSIVDAIAREKQLKNWKREWKNELVVKQNADWKDLSESVGVTQELIERAKGFYCGSGFAMTRRVKPAMMGHNDEKGRV